MTRTVHRIYIATLVSVVVLAVISLLYMGLPYYQTSLTERFYHKDHEMLKPSGPIGHGLGIVGTLMILFGVGSYMTRKRNRRFRRWGVLKHWLEFHIFLCTLGPFLVLFHTSFKFGGIVSVSFWSMVGVVMSGVIGRFIYIQIPRTIQGRELSLNEVRDMKMDIGTSLKESYNLDDESYQMLVASTRQDHRVHEGNLLVRMAKRFWEDSRTLRKVRSALRKQDLSRGEYKKLVGLVKNELSLNQKLSRLETMQKLFKYWHVAHLPFALIMLIIMVVHVAVTLTFGYRWIF